MINPCIGAIYTVVRNAHNENDNNNNEVEKTVERRMKKFSPKTIKIITILKGIISWMPIWVNLIGSAWIAFDTNCLTSLEDFFIQLGMVGFAFCLFGWIIFSFPALLVSLLLKDILENFTTEVVEEKENTGRKEDVVAYFKKSYDNFKKFV